LFSKYSVTDNVKQLNVELSRGFDISVYMLNILTVMNNHTTWSDYFWSDLIDYILI